MKIIVSVKDWSSMGLDLYYHESIPFLSYKCKSLTTLEENLSFSHYYQLNDTVLVVIKMYAGLYSIVFN